MTINKALAMQLLDLQHRLQEAEGIVAGLFDGPVFQSTNIQPRMCSEVDETEPPVMWNATAHALGCQMNNGRPVLACVCGLPNKDLVFPDPDLTRCPQCGGPADNGHDRCLPPNPYACSKCQPPADPPIPAMPDPVSFDGYSEAYAQALEAHARELERRLGEAINGRTIVHLQRNLDAARAEVARLGKEVKRRDSLTDDWWEKCDALQAQVQTLAGLLRRLGSHAANCSGAHAHMPCKCGLRSVLASLEVKP